MKARRYGIWASLAIVAAITSGALLAQAPQAIGTWVSIGDLSSPLTNGASVALPDKRTLIAGGALADGTLTDAVTIYDSVDDSAAAAGTLTSARADHTATLLKDGRVLVVGGMTADGLVSSDIEIFDPATGTSAIVALLPEPRNGHVAAALPNGNVLIAGGATVDGAILQTAVLFDPETSGVFSVPGHLHTARVHASATTMLDGRVLVAGGSNGTTELASAEIYDRYSQSFSMAATQMSVGRQGHSAVLLPDNGGVLVAGGTSNGVAQAGVDVFLPAVFPDPFSYGEGEFASTGAMTAARTGAVAGPTSVEGYAFAAAGGSPDAEVYRFATIKTDKDDYAPGELATITGSGWQANEEVTLLFQEDPAVHDDYVLKVNADGNGNIFWNQWAPEQHDFGVRFFLTATDSKSKAQTTFTDGNKVTFSTSASGIEVTDFGTATANQCVNAWVQERQGSNIDNGNHAARSVILSSAPAGAAFFAGLNCVTSTSAVTIAANTPAIAFSFKIANPSATQYTINGDAGLTGSNNPSATITFPGQKTNQTITVTQGAPPTASFGSTFNVAATASSGLPVTITTSGVCTGTGSNGSATITMTSGAGTCTVRYNQAGNTAYNAATEVTTNTTAAKANATINVTPYTVTYDGSSHTATGMATGVNSENLAALLDLTGTAHTNAGNYATDPWIFGGNTNYNSTSGTVVDKINQADAVCTITPYSAAYDGSAHKASGSCTGVDAGGSAAGSTLDLGASFTNVPGGTATWHFTGGTNYKDQSATVAITISKANATIVVNGYNGVYDGAAHGATGTAKGVLNEPLAGLDLGMSYTNVPGGTATWSFTDSTGNYNNATGTAAIVISKADAAIVVNGYNGVYDGAAHGATGTAKGVLDEPLAGLNLGVSFTNVPGGTATWSFTDSTGNYNNATGTAAIVISKADATIVVNGYNGVYDGAAHGATGTAKGVLNEPLAGLDLGMSYTNVPGGTATWSFTDSTGNYNNATGTAAIVISKADATIVVNGYNGVYDGAAHGATGTAKGVLNEPLAGLDLGMSYTNVPGGTATWSFTDSTGNYNNATGTAAIVISKADATIVVNGYNGVYDGAAHGATGTAKGVLNEPLAGLDLGMSYTNVPGGTATWSFTDSTGNYNNATGTAAIVISKADAAIVVNGYNGVYDGAAHGATGTAKGVLDEPLAGLNLGVSFTNVPGGTATWSFTDSTGNYNNATGTAAIVISKADATIVVNGYNGVYDGAAHGATGTAKGVLNEPLAGLDLGMSYTNVPGGTATWSFTDSTGNYNNATGTAAIVISKADATIVVNGYNGVYDGAAHGATGTAKGVLDEPLAGLNLGVSFTNVPGGTATWSFTDSTGNYNNATGTAAIVISKADATIVVNGYNGVYDGAAHGATGTAKGVLNEPLAGLDLGMSYTNVPGGTAHWVFTDGTGNYNNAAGDVAITISKADATINVNGYTGVYDGQAHGATGTAKGVLSEALAGLDLGMSFTNVPGGTATWNFAGNTNYKSASGSVAIVINKRTLTITPDGGKTKILGEVFTAFTGTAAGLQGNDTGAATYASLGAAAGATVGSYDITVTFAFTSGAGSNYDVQLKTAVKGLVVLYRWDGFLQPINDTAHDLGPMSKFKAGQTIPAKFVLKNAAGAAVQQTGVPTFTHTAPLGACDSAAALENPEPVPASVVPQYTWDGTQYHYNWSTKGLPAGLYRIFANLADGTARSVDICLTK